MAENKQSLLAFMETLVFIYCKKQHLIEPRWASREGGGLLPTGDSLCNRWKAVLLANCGLDPLMDTLSLPLESIVDFKAWAHRALNPLAVTAPSAQITLIPQCSHKGFEVRRGSELESKSLCFPGWRWICR